MGANLLIIEDGKKETIVFPKGHNFDKIFALAYKAQDSKTALVLLKKELALFRKVKEKEPEVVQARIERKKIDKQIKSVIRKIDVSTLPITLTPEWETALKTADDPTSLENFLIWLSMNDNERTRKDFLKSFSSKYPYITQNGYIVSVRAVWKEKVAEDGLYDFIQSMYVKIKGQKKGVKNYVVVKNLETNTYLLEKEGTISTNQQVCNLQELYENYKSEEKTVYVSNYSKNTLRRSDNWTIGSVAEIHDKATHTNVCGINQLHILSNPKDALSGKWGNYGDTFLLVLVNPKDVINISEGWKYTTSRFYIAAEISKSEIDAMFTKDWGTFEYDYLQHDVQALKEQAILNTKGDFESAKKETLERLKTQREATILKNRTDHIEPELYTEILDNRIQLIKK